MKKLTLLLSALVITGAVYACDGKGKGDKACCKKGEKKECCKKDSKSCDKHETAKKTEKTSADKKS